MPNLLLRGSASLWSSAPRSQCLSAPPPVWEDPRPQPHLSSLSQPCSEARASGEGQQKAPQPWIEVESRKPRQEGAPFTTLPPAPSLAPSPEQGCAALCNRCGWYLTPSHPHPTPPRVYSLHAGPLPASVSLSVVLNCPSSDYLMDQRRQQYHPVTHSLWAHRSYPHTFPPGF